MPYQELYKKYRPTNFDEVVGQENVVEQIKTLIENDRVPTGMCFLGNPGCGKTTLSKLIAKALNCEHPINKTTPCNECETCKAIDNNNRIGVKYFSAANTGGVDDVREIAKDARLSYPIKKPVFIIDECHNLSKAAFDALLIPLEDENMNTLFCFCSTEPDKIPPAILSRTQNFTIAPIHWKTLATHLYNICKKENISNISKEALISCAQSAQGSVRNAIQNLETVLNSGELPSTSANELIKAIVVGDVVKVVKEVREMNSKGIDFIKTIDNLYKDFTIALEVVAGDKSVATPNSLLIAKNCTAGFILKSIDLLGEGISSIKNKLVSAQTLFEIPLIKIALLSRQMNMKK
jgi:DNA polymerase-3 subunit gamma/tau